ncbi:MAG: hypothetical protein GWN83_06395 [Gemmatimonadetes bacterium]|nr:hypothetical protein [Gemmatimonadota bacterium]
MGAGFTLLAELRDHGSGYELDKTYVPGLAEVVGTDPATNGAFRYLTHDHLGSTRGVFDANKASAGMF